MTCIDARLCRSIFPILYITGVHTSSVTQTLDKQSLLNVRNGNPPSHLLHGELLMQEKLRRRLASVELKPLNAPRPGKKVVVLDIDYTIFDLVCAPGGHFASLYQRFGLYFCCTDCSANQPVCGLKVPNCPCQSTGLFAPHGCDQRYDIGACRRSFSDWCVLAD